MLFFIPPPPLQPAQPLLAPPRPTLPCPGPTNNIPRCASGAAIPSAPQDMPPGEGNGCCDGGGGGGGG
ncbi:hypothetical protein E2C01_074399 [Portunus trituberculatus]|uniref:Uncharacterized protein n=1 Tax=Portunus trituberculatus TaxID=210409 RepID=A0A5B7IG74_PORTR|nr:hypothetical protein [Portunus trituberculatus]